MQIAVIGTGSVGSVLGRRWARAGHEVVFGTRRPEDENVRALVASAGENARANLPDSAASECDVVVLAVPYANVESLLGDLGDLDGKIVVDCTNPILPGLRGLSVGTDDSGAERIARLRPDARVVKAFNTTGADNMEDPNYPSGRLTMFVCGDDAPARETVKGLAADLGFEPVDCGPLSSARYLEPVAMLWITMAYRLGGGPGFGFTVLGRG